MQGKHGSRNRGLDGHIAFTLSKQKASEVGPGNQTRDHP